MADKNRMFHVLTLDATAPVRSSRALEPVESKSSEDAAYDEAVRNGFRLIGNALARYKK